MVPGRAIVVSMAMLADVVLVLHFGFVLFVVGGFAAVVLGAACGWKWVRNRGFRLAHLGAIAFVVLESLAGIVCPLTAWENALRGSDDTRSFIGRWVAWLLYYDWPEWVFTIVYIVFGLAVAAAWLLVPPATRRARTRLSSAHD
jgi:hypothetical protein